MAAPSGTPIRVSDLIEVTDLMSGWIVPILGSGNLYKMTLDTFARFHNNQYYLGNNADPLATDEFGNVYGRYHFTTNNEMISGDPLAFFRLEQTQFTISKSGSNSPTPFLGLNLFTGVDYPANLVFENKAGVDNSYSFIGSKGTGDRIGSHINFIQTGYDEASAGIGFFTRTPNATNTKMMMLLSDLGYLGIGNDSNPDSAIHIQGTGNTAATRLRIENNANARLSIIPNSDNNNATWKITAGPDEPIVLGFDGGYDAIKLEGFNKHVGFNTDNVAVSGYQFNGEMLVTGNLMVQNSGISIGQNWFRPQAKLHITGDSSDTEGILIQSRKDAFIKLFADTDNSFEDDNPYILMTQDGGLVSGVIGLGADNNAGPLSPISGVRRDSLVIGSRVKAGFLGGIQFVTENDVRMTITSGGAIGVGGPLAAPSGVFHITGNGFFIDYDNLPSSDPGFKGQVYRDGSDFLKISAG